jgi:hypothetical protein
MRRCFVQSHPRVFASVAMTIALLWGGACASSAEPLAENRACFRALDCQEGLVCVLGRCTSDIAPIVPEGAGTGAIAEPSPEPAPEPGEPDPAEDSDPYDD